MSFEIPTDPYHAVLGLRVVRNYRPEPISDDDLAAILEAGRWTGSSKNRQKWAFVVLDDAETRERVAGCGSFSQPLRNSVLAIVPIRLPDGNDFDIGRLAQNLMLAALARGIGSCPITLHNEECAAEVLELPAGHQARYAICLGYPDEEAERAQRASREMGGRKTLDELVRRNRF
jgi:nitroreductase